MPPPKAQTLLRREPGSEHLAAYRQQRHGNHVEQLVREMIGAMSDPTNYAGIDMLSDKATSHVKCIIPYEEEADVASALAIVRDLLHAFSSRFSRDVPTANPGIPLKAMKLPQSRAECMIPMPFVATSAEESARVISKMSKLMLSEARRTIFPQSGRYLQ